MYTSKNFLPNYSINFPLETYAPLEKILFLDIETTGLSPSSSELYMIGLAYYTENGWCIEQWMAERLIEERELLIKLSAFLPSFTHILHFNGNRFDIPYLTERARVQFVELSFENFTGIDIYKRISVFKNLLVLPDCRQKTIEQFLGINRLDKYSGGELIQIYKTYTESPTNSGLELLIQHNYDDMKGMLDIVPILSYSEICNIEPTVTRVEMLKTKNVNHQECYELVMYLTLPMPLPKKFFAHFDGNMITAEGSRATLKVPVYEEELKFFYSNYKEYYYIPTLDAAFHKSVASHIDAEYRTQASASNCYTRKDSFYLKQYDILVEPFFKKEYKDKETFFEITEEIKGNRRLFSRYACHILHAVVHAKR